MTDKCEKRCVAVMGIGSMGGSIARHLIDSPCANKVTGAFDVVQSLVRELHQYAVDSGKAQSDRPPNSVRSAVEFADCVILMLSSEDQCTQLAFGGCADLITNMKKGSCLICCSTVKPEWAKRAAETFSAAGIYYVDCPVSGGPKRAREGELTVMAAGDVDSLEYAMPVLKAMGKVHKISGGAGAASKVKMINQLVAGVNLCATAEALALATKSGIDPKQMYEVVNDSAAASFMFEDRGLRMIEEDDPEPQMHLNNFVSDLRQLSITARSLNCPLPLASAAASTV
eukprot:CAMPEP_0113310438 /NCGR_PEP_ID=MMETSP0010_2-20120614/8081_1 /TAXON_ID=216773 ORGANISM="Corethron hystrix, Strain 308" /NCGR_SAMPLE_ID=MMETSP0010_2 /ASSEMBLY_ACC=CAM_ASM_000155 /LENGTH=284 /DNA_ID=CAMNT_0000165889 /DNA_START=237 /DNA_END=1090 /DNA_ORIENTATION=- /assembly_acc=CAM_ASM_000155